MHKDLAISILDICNLIYTELDKIGAISENIENDEVRKSLRKSIANIAIGVNNAIEIPLANLCSSLEEFS